MAEHTIVFRLRFAVALGATTLLLLLAVGALNADAAPARAEYIVQMKKGTSPPQGSGWSGAFTVVSPRTDAPRHQRLRRAAYAQGRHAACGTVAVSRRSR